MKHFLVFMLIAVRYFGEVSFFSKTRRSHCFFLEIQSKEMAEMLSQEDLGEIGLSSPSEQVAYLLVERATLLERLEAAEGKLESHTLAVTNSDHGVRV